MQAIILAAGMGKRLGKLTQNNTKAMIKVNGVTLIERMLCQIEKFGIRDVIMVVGYKALELKQYISTLNTNLQITYVENEEYNSTNNIYSLYLAKDYLLKEDTLLFESDLIFEDKLIHNIITDPYPNLALVAKFESWMDGTVITVDNENNIKNFITKQDFVFKDIPSYYKTVNIYKFSKEFSSSRYVPFLEAYCKALGNNEYYEQVLKVISLLEKPDIKALKLGDENWYEIDDIQDLDIAETIFADEETKVKKMQSRYGGYWRYPHMLDFCYLVNPFFPNEKLLSEIKANFERLVCEYPSGLSVNNLLVSKYFDINKEYICVGNGAAELINAFAQTRQGNTGVIFPTFEEYPNRMDSQNIIKYIPSNQDYTYTANDLINFYSDKNLNTLILINPDNPSGNFLEKEDLTKLLEWTNKQEITLLLDESFVDFSNNFEENSLLKDCILEQYQNLVVVKSISKSYGVPGLRLGVIATAHTELLKRIKSFISIWNINSIAEFYLQIHGKYENNYKEACHLFIKERNRFFELLKTIPYLRVIPSQANYFLCEVSAPHSASNLTQRLLNEYNILIKDCSQKQAFEGKEYIRIAIRDEKDNDTLINALSQL